MDYYKNEMSGYKGTLIMASSMEEVIRGWVDAIEKYAMDEPIPPEVKEAFVQEKLRDRKKSMDLIKPPVEITRLLQAPKKRKAISVASRMVITDADLMALLVNTDKMGFTYKKKFPKFMPEHLRISPKEAEAAKNAPTGKLHGDAATFMSKLRGGFEQRKNMHVHMLEKGSEWHCFFFDYNDAFSTGMGKEPHWAHGDHIHYISHLWGWDFDSSTVWDALDNRDHRLPSVHIRYKVI